MEGVSSEQVTDLVTYVALVVAISAGYARAFGETQAYAVQAIIDAWRIASRWRPILNIAVGVAIATAFAVAGAYFIHEWSFVPAGILGGILAAVSAAKVHDQAEAGTKQ